MRKTASVFLTVSLMAACADSDVKLSTEPDVLVVPVFAHVATQFRAHASGSEEVPANDSRAQGNATFKLNDDGTLSYKLIVANIENVTQSHIHQAARGVNGGIVVWLYPAAPPAQLIEGTSQGILAEGTITDAQVIGGLAGQGVAGLLEQMRAGNTYVNVHTSRFPPGEVRGQIH
ncbi:MAG: CHRD domain-containing protein [Gemmatimonadota bacterium]